MKELSKVRRLLYSSARTDAAGCFSAFLHLDAEIASLLHADPLRILGSNHYHPSSWFHTLHRPCSPIRGLHVQRQAGLFLQDPAFLEIPVQKYRDVPLRGQL